MTEEELADPFKNMRDKRRTYNKKENTFFDL